ncbi:TonB-dependent receptor [Neptunitalea chrysea]|uniref:TonB-dependent receptor n=2 Tax=Neptunitalea chrysea TaxID=1647581 RepID=A0A9W6EUF0_9FLAO|nr:TonB-dependent receptor [Neptunitalea chrysea]
MQAQNIIKGSVKEVSGEQLPFANVVLYKAPGEEVVTGVVTDNNGNYIFESITDGDYHIIVSVLGFKTKKSENFTVQGNETKVLNFDLEETTENLEEVVVTKKKPTIKQTAEKLIVDLEDAETVSTNLSDVMKKVPGLIVSNDKVTYAGQQGVRILINGKTTDYMDLASLLRDMPADNIAKVELIKQPGAEFDAAGSGPIVNIILKKNVKLGTYGNVKAYQGYDNQYEYATSASVASYKNKINWQLGGGLSHYASREDLFITRTVGDAVYKQSTISPYDPKTYRVNGRLDYYINEFNSLGVSSRYSYTDSDRATDNGTAVITATSTEELLTNSVFNKQQNVFNVNPYYEFDNKKDKVNVDVNFVDYTNDNVNDLYQVGQSSIDYDNQRYFQNSTYQILTFKGDYKHTLSENFSYMMGAKYSMVDTDSDLQSYTENSTGTFEYQTNQSNRFLVDENILALYTKVSGKVGKWSYSGGVRWEQSDTKGTSTNPQKTNERNISKIFPSASISREFSEHFGANVSYSYRISRPSYNSLNSFVYYYDPYTYEKGNANLKPEFTHNTQFSLLYDSQPFFSVAYGKTSDALFEIITQDDTTAEVSRSMINLANREYWNFSLYAPLNFLKGMDGYVGVIVNYNKYSSDELSPRLYLDNWGTSAFFNVQYTLPWKINAEVFGYYNSSGLEGQIKYDWIANMNAAFSRKFMNEKLKVNVGVGDILNRKFMGTVTYSNVDANVVSDWYRRNVYMQLTYSFGNSFKKEKKRTNSSQEEENRIQDNK